MTGKNGQEKIEAAADEAAGVIAGTAGRLKGVAVEAGNTAQEYANTAQEYAREAGRQAGAMAQTAYSTGNEAFDVVEDVIRRNPWAALLIAGAAGYGLACLVKSGR
jgi:ElaB/YqjD/DUF883 family membrane-anchored ribosome-binding protein